MQGASNFFEPFLSNIQFMHKMKTNSNRAISRTQKPTHVQGVVNWVFVASGALLGTLSVRLGISLKQALERKWSNPSGSVPKEDGELADEKQPRAHSLHSTMCYFTRDEDGYCQCPSEISGGMAEMKQLHPSLLKETALPLPLVTVTASESTKQQNGVIWGSALEYDELPHKPSYYSNSSGSPCISESGSDMLSKREVINKLRQQLKRRDEMILEMQAQITDLQSSSNAQLMHSAQMQSRVDLVNHNLFEAEREIQRLRKVIADQCMDEIGSPEKPMVGKNGLIEPRNGHVNGLLNNLSNTSADKACAGGQYGERVEMLKREVEELKEVIEAKEFLLRNYKEQNMELCSKMKELQFRLASHVPSIL